MASNAEKITERVLALLQKRSMTRQELAKRIGMSQPGLSHVLGGKVPWKYERLTTAAQVLGVDVLELLGGEAPAKTINRVCVELSPAELQVLQEAAAGELRTLENYVHLILHRHIQTIDEQ